MGSICNGIDIRRNGSGYYDPTAYQAIKNVEKEEQLEEEANFQKLLKEQTVHGKTDDERFHKLMDTIFGLCELSGFHIEGRITIKDTKTGKIWR